VKAPASTATTIRLRAGLDAGASTIQQIAALVDAGAGPRVTADAQEEKVLLGWRISCLR